MSVLRHGVCSRLYTAANMLAGQSARGSRRLEAAGHPATATMPGHHCVDLLLRISCSTAPSTATPCCPAARWPPALRTSPSKPPWQVVATVDVFSSAGSSFFLSNLNHHSVHRTDPPQEHDLAVPWCPVEVHGQRLVQVKLKARGQTSNAALIIGPTVAQVISIIDTYSNILCTPSDRK
jgi:hypothetical protein